MKKSKSYVLSGLGVVMAFCAAFASVSFSQQAWYNAAADPSVDPTIAMFASITTPNNTDVRVQSSLCSTTANLVVCSINGRQAFADQGLTQPLLRDFQ
ncbi:MAG: hypothetical protein MJA30_11265 [Cytophagales bacterium]|nr:hypothetical protein [Cytophagales bacterium]